MTITAFATSDIDAGTIAAGANVLQNIGSYTQNLDGNNAVHLAGATGYAPDEQTSIILHKGAETVDLALKSGIPAAGQIQEALKAARPGSTPAPNGPDPG